MEYWPVIKTILEVIIGPLLALLSWLVSGYINTVKEIDKRVTILEKDTAKDVAVILTKLENLDEKIDRIEKLLERNK